MIIGNIFLIEKKNAICEDLSPGSLFDTTLYSFNSDMLIGIKLLMTPSFCLSSFLVSLLCNEDAEEGKSI